MNLCHADMKKHLKTTLEKGPKIVWRRVPLLMQWHETAGKGFKLKSWNGEYLVTQTNPKRDNKLKKKGPNTWILSYIVKWGNSKNLTLKNINYWKRNFAKQTWWLSYGRMPQKMRESINSPKLCHAPLQASKSCLAVRIYISNLFIPMSLNRQKLHFFAF